MTETAYIGIGSNLGDREAAVRSALEAIDHSAGVRVVRASSLVETEPVGPAGQPRYINAVACVRTSLDPRGLLEVCQEIERAHGRDRAGEERWGPRPLDLDLLLFGDRVIDEPGLVVPHPRLHERGFVLVPLAEVAGELIHPVLGQSVESLARSHA